jgi:hypothetical protein
MNEYVKKWVKPSLIAIGKLQTYKENIFEHLETPNI